MRQFLTQDWAANAGNRQFQILMFMFRASSLGSSRSAWSIASRITRPVYRAYSEFLLGMEIPPGTRIGGGLVVRHGRGIVVHRETEIGSNVLIRQGVTIGVAKADGRAPKIGDRVEIGAGAILLGPIHVGDDSTIGAGSVVLKDVNSGSVVVGNPARELRGG